MNTANKQPKASTTLHGVLLSIDTFGVLITGESGIGKSEVALGLIHRGHALIADDCVEITQGEQHLIGSCPELLQNFLEVRGLGILNIHAMYGDKAICPQSAIDLIIHMVEGEEAQVIMRDRLNSQQRTQQILDTILPVAPMPVAPARSLTVLVEAAVRNQQLKNSGYDAGNDFQCIQEQQIAGDRS